MTDPATAPAAASETTPAPDAPAAEQTLGDAILEAAKERGDLAPANSEQPADAPAENDNAPPPAEKPAEAPKPTERDTALFRAALKAREATTKQLEAVRAERAASERAAQEAARVKAEVDAERARYEAIKRDPMKFFDVLGVDPNDFARHLLQYNEKKPEDREREQKLETMAARLERLEKEKAELEEKQQAQSFQQNVRGAQQNFWKHVETNANQYPHLAVGDPDDVVDVFWDLAKRHYDNTGSAPTFQMVAAHLENVAAEKAARIEQRRKQLLGASTSEIVTQAPRQTSPSANGAPPRSPTTLTNAASAQRATPPKQMTKEETDAWAIELLRQSFSK